MGEGQCLAPAQPWTVSSSKKIGVLARGLEELFAGGTLQHSKKF